MSDNENRFRQALQSIAELARVASEGDGGLNGEDGDFESYQDSENDALYCLPKALPRRLLMKAADTAARVNPMNAPLLGRLAEIAAPDVLSPLMISVMVTKYWGRAPRRLTVSFMDTTPADLRTRIVSHMNAWTKTGGISFAQTQSDGNVRISRSPGGYWSYLGTDILLIPKNRQTMNLQGFTMSTPESEYLRVVRHETGHTLGFPHEHMRKALVARIDRKKAYKWFLDTYGWDKATVDQQVLTPLNEKSLIGTPADQTSIMCYQLPGVITTDGKPIIGGKDINPTDYAFAGRIYPKAGLAAGDEAWDQQAMTNGGAEDWDESEDVVHLEMGA